MSEFTANPVINELMSEEAPQFNELPTEEPMLSIDEIMEGCYELHCMEFNIDSVELIDGTIGQPDAVYSAVWKNAPADLPKVLYTKKLELWDYAGWTPQGYYPAEYRLFWKNPPKDSAYGPLGLPNPMETSAVELIHGTVGEQSAVYRGVTGK